MKIASLIRPLAGVALLSGLVCAAAAPEERSSARPNVLFIVIDDTYLLGNHAVRSERWRYIRNADGGEELYDESDDPLEWTNLAAKPELAPVKIELAWHLPIVNTPAPEAGAARRPRGSP